MSHQFVISEFKDGRFVGIVLKNGKLIANSLPSSKGVVGKFIDAIAYDLQIKDPEIKEETHEITQLIFEIDRDPKKKWEKSKNIEVDYSMSSGKQAQVLKALREVNVGEVLSYGELAEKAGIKNGARFVGNCMASNNMPLILPCHRVIKSDGSLGNYSGDGGSHRKKVYLTLESSDIL